MYSNSSSFDDPGITRDYQVGPKPLPDSAFSKVAAPLSESIQLRPAFVFVNVPGGYAFLNSATASIGTKLDPSSAADYVTGSVVNTNAGPVRLDIQPLAWRKTSGVGIVGDVTFVYKGGL